MEKPSGYDAVRAAGEYVPLELGGHILVIKQVEETKSSTKKDMLKIHLDTAPTDRQPGYYQKQFADDIRPEKKWGCTVYQLVYDNEGNTNRGLKTFITSVEKSNPGFAIQWGQNFTACLKNKEVGGVFGQEEYLNSNGEIKKSTKCFFFRSIEVIKSGVDAPKMREYKGNVAPAQRPGSDGFMNIPDDVMDEELPFN